MKNLTLAGLIALLLNAAGALINYLYFRANNTLLIKWSSHGGEITVEHGFGGISATHIYGMMPGDVTTHSLRFSPAVFLISFVLTFAVVYLVVRLVRRAG